MASQSSKSENKSIVKWAMRLGKLSNETEMGKALQYLFARSFSYQWIKPFMQNRILADGLDYYKVNPPPGGIVSAANHRSFFDAYIYTLALWAAQLGWPTQFRFPVRSNFFYDNPLGIFVNYAISGGAMYPPIFRDPSLAKENQTSFEDMVSFLEQKNAMVGVHPEGRRNKSLDPYQLLPAQPGIGKIVIQSNATVVPIFVNGATNNFIETMSKGLKSGSRRTDPIIVVFGKPVDASQFKKETPRAAIYKKCSDYILEHIAECGKKEQLLRQHCLDGSMDDADPRWIFNFK